jgi:hypothetical protein
MTILLRREISDGMIESVCSRLRQEMDDPGRADAIEADVRAFLEHLVLHEIAHALDPGRSEAECGFQQMGL